MEPILFCVVLFAFLLFLASKVKSQREIHDNHRWDQFANGFVASAIVTAGIACLAVLLGAIEALFGFALIAVVFLGIGMRWGVVRNKYYGAGIFFGGLFVIAVTFPILLIAGIKL